MKITSKKLKQVMTIIADQIDTLKTSVINLQKRVTWEANFYPATGTVFIMNREGALPCIVEKKDPDSTLMPGCISFYSQETGMKNYVGWFADVKSNKICILWSPECGSTSNESYLAYWEST